MKAFHTCITLFFLSHFFFHYMLLLSNTGWAAHHPDPSFCIKNNNIFFIIFLSISFLCFLSPFILVFFHFHSFLSFFLSSQVLQSNLVHYPNITHTHGLVTTILGLRVILDGSHFRNGSMRVKCLTSVLPMLTLNTDGYNNGRISYAQRRPPPLDNREAMLLGMYRKKTNKKPKKKNKLSKNHMKRM